jgi:DNA-3-methyladenine glycosylase
MISERPEMLSERHLQSARRLPGRALPSAFFARNTVRVARDLLGCLLCRRERDGTVSFGRIVETEAYVGEDDPACHAARGRTPRTRVLYGPPGRAYVYFNYGMHHLLNAVTERDGFPGAVLLRALSPERGLTRMIRRRGTERLRDLTSGPSRLCQALGIDLTLNDVPLDGPTLFIREDGFRCPRVERGPRVGIRVGTDHLWRFWLASSPFVSRARPHPPRRRRSRGASRASPPA